METDMVNLAVKHFKLTAERMFRQRAIEVLRAHAALVTDLIEDDTLQTYGTST